MAARTSSLKADLEAHRARVERTHRVRNAAQLVAMVDAVGFCFAFTGERAYPVPACFDHLSTSEDGKKWEWMWPWKDELVDQPRDPGRVLPERHREIALGHRALARGVEDGPTAAADVVREGGVGHCHGARIVVDSGIIAPTGQRIGPPR